VEDKLASSLVVSLNKLLNGMPLPLSGWTRVEFWRGIHHIGLLLSATIAYTVYICTVLRKIKVFFLQQTIYFDKRFCFLS